MTQAPRAWAALLLGAALGPACATPPVTRAPAPKPAAPLALPVGGVTPDAVFPSPHVAEDGLVIARDGTAVRESAGCRTTPRSGCSIAVRRPGAHAFHVLESKGATRYWLFARGAVGVRIEAEGNRSRFALTWIPDDGPAKTVVEGAVDDLIDVVLELDVVEVVVENGSMRGRLVVIDDGSLVPL